MRADWTDLLADARCGISLRPITDADLPFLAALYASTRDDELSVLDWNEPQKQAFLDSQFQAQHAHYRRHYPTADLLLIEHAGRPAGRIYLDLGREELRLMEIALTPRLQGRGIGSAMIERLLAYADQCGLIVGLHVETFNPAMRLYRRCGFEAVENRGVYEYLQRTPSPTGTQANTAS